MTDRSLMPPPVTAAMLYDLAQYPRRPTMDLDGTLTKRDEMNPFVKLLW